MSNFRFSGRILSLFILIAVSYLILTTTSLVEFTRSIRVVHTPFIHNETILLYRAYYDNRSGPGNIRILAISPCLPSSTPISITSQSVESPLFLSPIEKFCPWKWAPDCKWNAYHFLSPPLPYPPHSISVTVAGRSVDMSVHSVPSLHDSLQVCVPPLYWYSDWPRLLLFVSFWKREGASISIYVNSVSANVNKVLDHYQNEGIIEVINWPLLPQLKNEDPNKSVYRLSHSLAHNDCVLRSHSKYTTLLDLDEFILVRNSSILNFVRSKFSSDPSIGSLQFEHRGLISDFLLDETFNALDTMDIRVVEGPSKVVFNPSSILFLSTHRVNTHVEGFNAVTITPDQAFLLHNRISFGDKIIGERIEIDNGFMNELKEELIETRDTIFGSNTPLFTPNVSNEVVRCNSDWRIEGCKTPIYSCYSTLISMEEWTFFPPSTNSHFNVL